MIYINNESKVVYNNINIIPLLCVGSNSIYNITDIEVTEGEVLFKEGVHTGSFKTDIAPEYGVKYELTFTPQAFNSNMWLLSCRYTNSNGNTFNANLMQYETYIRYGGFNFTNVNDKVTVEGIGTYTVGTEMTSGFCFTKENESTDKITIYGNGLQADYQSQNKYGLESSSKSNFEISQVSSSGKPNAMRVKSFVATDISTGRKIREFVFRKVGDYIRMFDKVTGKYYEYSGSMSDLEFIPAPQTSVEMSYTQRSDISYLRSCTIDEENKTFNLQFNIGQRYTLDDFVTTTYRISNAKDITLTITLQYIKPDKYTNTQSYIRGLLYIDNNSKGFDGSGATLTKAITFTDNDEHVINVKFSKYSEKGGSTDGLAKVILTY